MKVHEITWKITKKIKMCLVGFAHEEKYWNKIFYQKNNKSLDHCLKLVASDDSDMEEYFYMFKHLIT